MDRRAAILSGLSTLLPIVPALGQVPAAVHPTPAHTVGSPGRSKATPTRFTDITSAAGVHFQHIASHTPRKYLIETMGSGVALFDYDNDGRLDIFLVNGAPLSDPTPKGTIPQKTEPKYWNRLYHQKLDGTFEDVTEKAGLQGVGYGMGIAVGDYDNDGYEDLYVTSYGGNKLYHNNGDGTFADVTEKAGVGGGGWSTSAAWVDLDDDGRLDLVVLRYLQWDFDDIWCGTHQEGFRAYCTPDIFQPIAPLVYHNDGDGHFTEVSTQRVFKKLRERPQGLALLIMSSRLASLLGKSSWIRVRAAKAASNSSLWKKMPRRKDSDSSLVRPPRLLDMALELRSRAGGRSREVDRPALGDPLAFMNVIGMSYATNRSSSEKKA